MVASGISLPDVSQPPVEARRHHPDSKAVAMTNTATDPSTKLDDTTATQERLLHLTEALSEAHYLLDVAGVPTTGKDNGEALTLRERITAAAERWLYSVNHTDGCQCHLCPRARAVVSANRVLDSTGGY